MISIASGSESIITYAPKNTSEYYLNIHHITIRVICVAGGYVAMQYFMKAILVKKTTSRDT
jgi:hypothetical protein